ncbi:hypothetical protein AGDE_02969 [Angomonas deanei]|nr:hypothetical protein AGDE_02969 [Angomonas deanei]|eukprot:EPY40956.1 hypothetical protein AGDE_02969 [Angomonas deanei]
MQTVLPYTTNPEQMLGCERMKILNPNSAAATGPFVNSRKSKLVVGGLLHNWDSDAAQSFLAAPKKSPNMGHGMG